MHRRFLPLGVAALLILGAPFAGAQVDTSEGGGEQFQEQEYGNPVETNEEEDEGQTREALQSQITRQEIADIKEKMRLVELIEAQRRKLIELEKRVRALESMHENSAGTTAKSRADQASPPARPQNGRAASAAALAHPPAPPVNNDSWRFRRFQGKWWYWTPDGRWVYWTGERWTTSVGRQAARR